MFDERTLAQSREMAGKRDAAYDKIVERFGNSAPASARDPKTHSGLPIKTAYFPHDVQDIDYSKIGAPGQYPFTRGNLAAQYQVMNWANQPVIGYGLPEDTRARMDLLSSRGMTGYFGQKFYNLVYDLVSHEGLDPDHPGARGRVGQCGMAVYSKADMARLFDGMDLTKMNVVHITYYQVVPALAQYIAYAEERGVSPDQLRGNSMNWYHQSAYVGMSAFPPENGHRLAVELIAYCAKHMPRWNTTNLFGYGVEEAGGTAVQEIGLMLAYGIDLVRACVQAGLTADQALMRFGFQIAQANDFFEEICKIRALRQLWATTMHEMFGAEDPRSMHVRIHTHTSGACLTAQQPLVNLIRTTLHAFGAALSGVQAMEVSAYDEALSIPTEESATLALRVQQVIQEETNITRVSDPLAGSYYVESLTDQMAKAALELVDKVEAQGGYIAAQQNGWIRREIEDSSERWREEVNSGERRIVGMNCYQAEEAEAAPEIFRVDAEPERVSAERVRDLRASRDAARYDKAIKNFLDAAHAFAAKDYHQLGDGELMEAAIEAARADATTGEMMGVMKEALGWRAPMNTEAQTTNPEVPALGEAVRVLLAKPTHDCHDRGVRLVARKFRDAGFEVIFSNFLLPSEIINTAVEEDVQVIGVSTSAGGHMPVFEDLIAGLKENGLEDVILIGGGVIPADDEAVLKDWGVKAVFGPGTTAEDAIDMIRTEIGSAP